MRLEIGANIDNKRVRLDFRKGGVQASYMPSYQIQKSKADEFVAKYNEQSSLLKKATFVIVAVMSVFGGIIGSHSKNKLCLPAGIFAGIIAGLGAGAFVSTEKRSKLMDEYEVTRLNG